MSVLDPRTIKDKRELRHLSQEELARRVDRSRSTIVQVESGRLRVVKRELAMGLTRELDLDFGAVFAYTDAVAMPGVTTTVHPTHKASA